MTGSIRVPHGVSGRQASSSTTVCHVGLLAIALLSTACATPRLHAASADGSRTVHTIDLPGASSAGVSLDYLAYDRAHGRVWVPAGENGTVAVIDTRDEGQRAPTRAARRCRGDAGDGPHTV